jgi:glycosyltransferase involved in cell wall biosynthesis
LECTPEEFGSVYKCLFDTRWFGDHGIGRFAREVAARMEYTELRARGGPASPLDPFRNCQLRSLSKTWLFSPGISAPLISRIPYVFTIHDLNYVDQREDSDVLKRAYFRTILSSLATQARGICTVSEFSKERIVDYFGVPAERVHNIGNGVSETFVPFGRCYRHARPYLLSVSNRRAHKNEPLLFRAYAGSRSSKECDLLVTGNCNAALAELMASLDIEARVHFLGRVSDIELAELYRGAVALLFPSLYEGFGLPVVEAFASATPVITSRTAALPEISNGAAMLINPKSLEEIRDSIDQVTEDSALRKVLIERGLERARSFTWDSVVARLRGATQELELC